MDLRADYLIVGSGIAGLRAVAELSPAGDVLILTKAEPDEGNTGHAQGGIAAAVGPGDSPALHASDTLAAGDGLCDERAVQALVEDGPRFVRELMDWGARFDRGPDGQLALAIEGAHSVRRVLHARDATGREIGSVLYRRMSAMPRVRPHAHARVVDLLIERGRCTGVKFLADDGTHGGGAGEGGAARDRRRGARLSRHDQSRRWRPATAWRWRTAAARGSPISSSCSSIRPR